jgi:polar amino acid transport system substrate-binding protein
VRKILVVLIAALALPATAAVDAGAAARPAGPLRVGAEVPQPGFWNDVPPGPGSFPGFEAELAAALATRLGRNGVNVVAIPFNTLIEGKGKRYDIAFEQALITDVDAPIEFSTPYLDFDVGILVRAGDAVPNASAARKLRWGVATSMATPLRFLQREVEPTTPPRLYPDLAGAVKALELQEIDAVLDYTVSAQRQAVLSGGKLAVVGQFRTGEQLGAVLPEDSPLLDKVNAGIKALRADGTLGRLAAIYLGGDPSTVPFVKV